MDSILQLLKSFFDLLAGLFDPNGVEDARSNRKKSVVAAEKYVRLGLAFVALCYLISVVPLVLWVGNLKKKNGFLELEERQKAERIVELGKSCDEMFFLGERHNSWNRMRQGAEAGIKSFSLDLAAIQNDVDWPGPGGENSEQVRGSIQGHFTTLESNLKGGTDYHQWLNAQLPADCVDLHKPILDAMDSYRRKLDLQKGQVNQGANLTRFKDDVCVELTAFIEALQKAIEKGDKSFSKAPRSRR